MMKKTLLLMTAVLLWNAATQAAIRDEWTFQNDAGGTVLADAINTGPDKSVFGPGGEGVLEANELGTLQSTPTNSTLWGTGAKLDADITDSTSLYLRYDLDYDLSSSNLTVGTTVSLGFVDNASNRIAGLSLVYDPAGVETSPAGTTLIPASEQIDLAGTLSAIAKVDTATDTMTVWFDTTGSNAFIEDSPAASVTISISSINDLRIQATGTATPEGSTDFVAVKNIRVTDSWAEIIEPLATEKLVLAAEITDGQVGTMIIGQTNTISVTIVKFGGMASNVTSALAFEPAAGGLSIISSSNAPVVLNNSESVTNTYEVVANTNGEYVLTALVSADGTVYSTNTLVLAVGQLISYDSYSITNEIGGLIAGKVEPGESFDLIITSVNDGAGTVNDITNSLTASNPTYLGISPAFDTYGSLDAGESTTTVYRVTCSADTPDGPQIFTVINRIAGNAWTSTFDLDILRQAVPSVTNSLTIWVAPGQTGSESVTLANDGNVTTPFTVTTDERLPVFYTVETQLVARISFWPAGLQPDTVFTNWTGTDSNPMDIDFGFTLFGTKYTEFSVSQYGFLTLSETGGKTAQLTPFQTAATVNQATLRYKRLGNEQLVVAWGNGTGQEFQLRLHADGTVEYLYEKGIWGAGDIKLGNQQIFHSPGQGRLDALLLAPESWVSFNPTGGNLNGFGSTRLLTFTANATAILSPAIYEFTATVDWDGSSDEIDVTVIVENANAQLTVPGTFAFSGPVGDISDPAILTVTNNGNVPLTYTITDTGLADADYTSEAVDYQWRHIPETATTVLPESKLGTESVAIGFPFVFFGNTYTNLTVWTDGTLTFDDGVTNIVYSANLTLDGNAKIRFITNAGLNNFTVTWDNMAEPGGSEDQTFQAVLNRDGTIRFNYRMLDGIPFDEILSVEDVLVYETIYVTNTLTIGNNTFISGVDEVETVVGTNMVTTYNEDFNRRSFEYTPGQPRIITFSPASGTIPLGEAADITLIGDARSLTSAETNDVDTATTLTFIYGVSSNAVAVTFSATNSVETAYPSAAAVEAMWGTDAPFVSSQQNSDRSRTLSWPAAQDDLSRTYAVWYTTSLSKKWTLLDTVGNAALYTDNQHNDEPVIFYKVTVQ